METKRKRESLYPRRIAGISFGEADYQRIQRVCQDHRLTEAQVIRTSVSNGLVAYDSKVHKPIRDAAKEFGIEEHLVVLGAINQGLREYVVTLRSEWRLEQLRQFREELVKENRAEDRNLDDALREYLERHAETLEDLMEEEKFHQKTMDREDEHQAEEDRELQEDFDRVTGNRSDS